MQGTTGSITFNPAADPRFFAALTSSLTFTIDPTNNLPAVVYDDGTYETFRKMDDVYKGATYASYGMLLAGMFCDKVIGV